MKNLLRPSLFTIALILCGCVCLAQVAKTGKKAETLFGSSGDPSPSGDRVVAGLKQALELSTTKAVAWIGRPDGFLLNENIRILLPPKLQAVGKAMRLLGEGSAVDDLEIGMNRAAERATPQAKQIFLEALKKMSFEDARHILTGDETAATEYFQRTSSEEISTAFTPIVHRSLQRIGVIQKYDHVIQTAPGGSVLANEFDLDKYVVDKTLSGLFYTLGQEEIKIRTQPAAQTTALMKEIFGRK